MQSPHNLFVARYAEDFVIEVYGFLRTLPPSERYNLESQMRRSATSVKDNINEGCGKQGNRALLPFLYHAHASAGELDGQFRQARRAGLGDPKLAAKLGRKAGRLQLMLTRLIKAIERRLKDEGC